LPFLVDFDKLVKVEVIFDRVVPSVLGDGEVLLDTFVDELTDGTDTEVVERIREVLEDAALEDRSDGLERGACIDEECVD